MFAVAARPLVQDVCVLLLAVLLFLRGPLTRLDTHAYTSADLALYNSLSRVDDGPRAGNVLLADPALQMLPWLLFDRDELGAGRLPLLNPFNGCGMPQLANHQSAVFSPFSWPLYLLPLSLGLLIAAGLKLFSLALGMRLWLGALGLSRLGALGGALAFTFSGHNLLLLAYPHAAVACVLPWSLWCFERVLAARRGRASARVPLVALCACVAVGLFAGQGEPLYFSALLASAYASTRLPELGARDAVRTAAQLVAVCLLGACIATVQWLPFIEYLRDSALWRERSEGRATLGLPNWPLWFQPDLLGNPSTDWLPSRELPSPIYAQVNVVYVGAFALVLAGLSLARWWSDRRAAFFGLAHLAWLAYAYDIGGAARVADWVPLLQHAPPVRSSLVGVFTLSTCAACGLDALQRARSPRWPVALSVTALAATLVFVIGATRLLESTLPAVIASSSSAAFESVAVAGSRWVLAWLALGVVAAASLAFVRAPRPRALAGALVLAALFAQSGEHLRGYNPLVAREQVYPELAPLRRVREHVGAERVVHLGHAPLLPDANLAWRLAMPTSYDALGRATYEELQAASAGDSKRWRLPRWITTRFLELFGTRYVLCRGPWPDVDPWFAPLRFDSQAALVPLSLTPTPALQRFRAPSEPQAVCVWLSGTPGAARATVELADVATGRVAARVSLSGSEWAALEADEVLAPLGAIDARPLVLRLSGGTLAGERDYELRLSASDSESFAAWTRPGLELDGLRSNPAGAIVFDACGTAADLEPLARPRGHHLYALRTSPGRAWCVARAEVLSARADRLQRLTDRGWSPKDSVVLEEPPRLAPADAPRSPGSCESLEEHPGYARYRVCSDAGTVVVATWAFDGGWRARIDGAPAPVLRANHAFFAVEAPPGEHELELVYSPLSLRIGAWVSSLSLAFAILLERWLARRPR